MIPTRLRIIVLDYPSGDYRGVHCGMKSASFGPYVTLGDNRANHAPVPRALAAEYFDSRGVRDALLERCFSAAGADSQRLSATGDCP